MGNCIKINQNSKKVDVDVNNMKQINLQFAPIQRQTKFKTTHKPLTSKVEYIYTDETKIESPFKKKK